MAGKKTGKRLLTWVLVLVMALSLLPLNALAAGGSETDSGSGIAQSVRSSVFSRYLRQPALEDSRYGIGLGMVLIRTAAAHHGGTVLIDQPEGAGTRITMTMSIRQSKQATLRSNVLRVDYAGERDHGLIELSECLPTELYE